MKTVLFQGDSITDAGRNRDNDMFAGRGYMQLVQAELGFEHPGEYTFLNRGIGGNRIVDLYSRIKSDIINLKPDYMSLLIGVNDANVDIDLQNGVDADKYYKIYCMLIEEVLEALPNIKIMILEPFILPGTLVPDKFEIRKDEVLKRAKMAKAVAEKYNIPFVPLQNLFDTALKSAPADYWLLDGVHPTPAGHELIKREWIKCFNTL